MLREDSSQKESEEAVMSSLFTVPVFTHMETLSEHNGRLFAQYGLLGGVTKLLSKSTLQKTHHPTIEEDPRLFTNITTPFSVFICGSQGSGKSHTLSCFLENCLLPSKVNKLSNPLTALVFHFDTFISDHKGSPCEAAFLSSHPKVATRILCSPTNIETIKVGP